MSDEPEAKQDQSKPKPPAHLKPHLWVKGQSGNPGGLSKDLKPIMKLAQEMSPDALRTLNEIMLDLKAPPNARVAAACHILDRVGQAEGDRGCICQDDPRRPSAGQLQARAHYRPFAHRGANPNHCQG